MPTIYEMIIIMNQGVVMLLCDGRRRREEPDVRSQPRDPTPIYTLTHNPTTPQGRPDTPGSPPPPSSFFHNYPPRQQPRADTLNGFSPLISI